MKKTFCDRCGKDVGNSDDNEKAARKLTMYIPVLNDTAFKGTKYEFDLCSDCALEILKTIS